MWNSLYPKHQRVSTTPRTQSQPLNTERGVLGTLTHCQPTTKKDEKRAPKKRKANVNETKNLSQTFLSRSTDKVLQPRIKKKNIFWFLCALLVQIRNIRVRATTTKLRSECTGNKIKTVVLWLSPALWKMRKARNFLLNEFFKWKMLK